MKEKFTYGTLGEEQSELIVNAYREKGSILGASLKDGVVASLATVARVVVAAVENGILSEEEKRSTGRPSDKRERAKEVLEKFPSELGYTRKEQARIAGCSEATIYRAFSMSE